MGTLYVTATPIGNLKDISQRALNVLESGDGIVCEDTRKSRKLLSKYTIKKPLYSFHKHSGPKKIESIISKLKQGNNLAFLTNAGTPSVSDPGFRLIAACYQEKISVIPIPGPSAVTCALSICGFPAQKFLFLGFVPKKDKQRKSFFSQIKNTDFTVCFFETPHRILTALDELTAVLDNNKQRKVFVGREMTKKFESYYRGTLKEVTKKVKSDPIKGEYTIIIAFN